MKEDTESALKENFEKFKKDTKKVHKSTRLQQLNTLKRKSDDKVAE